MNTSKTSRQQPDPEIATGVIDQTFSTLDTNRANGFAQMGQARAAKSASLAREQKLLSLKHGNGTHPRVQYAAAALIRNEQLRREMAASREVLEAGAPAVDANSFVVYGFVRRKNLTGIPGLTLALVDEQGNWLRQYGYACTDKRGFFELRIEAKTAGQVSDPVPAAKPVTGSKGEKDLNKRAEPADVPKEDTGLRPDSNPNIDSKSSVRLRVFNDDGRVLHAESRPVVLRANAIDFRRIILGDEDCGCTPPPGKSDGKQQASPPRRSDIPPPAPAPRGPIAQPRVAGLKSYQNPTVRGAAGSVDLPAAEKAAESTPVKDSVRKKSKPAQKAAKPHASVEQGAASAAEPVRAPTKRAAKKRAAKSPTPAKAKKRSKK